MGKESIRTSNAPRPKGSYSQGVRAGNFLFVATQGPFDPNTAEVVGKDIESQTRQTLENVKAIVKASGYALRDVVMVRVFLKNSADSHKMDQVYSTFFPQNQPARTVVEARVPAVDALIAIEAIAYG